MWEELADINEWANSLEVKNKDWTCQSASLPSILILKSLLRMASDADPYGLIWQRSRKGKFV